MHTFTLEKPGLFSSLQRIAPPSQVAYGIPFGGPMDRESARQANQLVGNTPSEWVLEMTLVGARIRFEQACVIALTGADMGAMLDGQLVARYQPLSVQAHQRLTLKGAKNGCRAYLAIGGTWQVDPSWTSLGTKALSAGAKLSIAPSTVHATLRYPTPTFSDKVSIPIWPGPEFDHISRAYMAHFFSQRWQISQNSNRVGCRLEGPTGPAVGLTDIISSGIVPGTIQITGSGQPILLTADAQTTGGYPRLGNVLAADVDVVGQLRPGATIRFVYQAIPF